MRNMFLYKDNALFSRKIILLLLLKFAPFIFRVNLSGWRLWGQFQVYNRIHLASVSYELSAGMMTEHSHKYRG